MEEKAGNWDARYSEKPSARKAEINDFSQQMFGKDFDELDTDDQERVIKALGESAMAFKAEEKAHQVELLVQLKDGRVIGTSGVLIDTKLDLYNDACTKACLKDMVRQINSRTITMDIEHEIFRGKDPLTKGLDKAKIPYSKIVSAEYKALPDGHAQVVIKDLLNTDHARYKEISGSIQNGYLHSYSIAFVPKKYEMKDIGGVRCRILDKVALLNVTHTGVPVNPRAEVGSVQTKSLSEEKVDELIGKFINGESIDMKDVNEGFALEAKSLGDKKMPEQKETPSASIAAEIKARIDALEKLSNDNALALKSLLEKKAEDEKEDEEEEKKKKADSETEQKALTEKDKLIAELKAQVESHEKILSAPQVKARIESADKLVSSDRSMLSLL